MHKNGSPSGLLHDHKFQIRSIYSLSKPNKIQLIVVPYSERGRAESLVLVFVIFVVFFWLRSRAERNHPDHIMRVMSVRFNLYRRISDTPPNLINLAYQIHIGSVFNTHR